MRSLATLAFSILSVALGEHIFQKDEVVKLEASSGVLDELVVGARKCDPQIPLVARDKSKTLGTVLKHTDGPEVSTNKDCKSPLQRYAGGYKLLIRYRHQVT
ncbi:unnamed protein product [Toxocara canis]|uniref:Secreted protein n=1 Tax=Toxocara canis TaxID=6265 RepID=A0A183U624_TOXCA|nr:unnamed protein product [Toxocara canis]